MAVLRGYFWFCTQGSLLEMLRGHDMPRIEAWLVLYKANVLMLYYQFHPIIVVFK